MASVAIVQDHIVQRGGGERVLLAMARALPDAPIYTSFYVPEAADDAFLTLDIRPAALNRFAALREHHRALLPLFPMIFSRLDVDADVAVCGSAGWSQGARVRGRKIVYFNALANWLYRPEQYLGDKGLGARVGLGALRPYLRRWDRRSATSAHRWLVQSRSMQRRVADAYGVDAEIVPPPVSLDTAGPQRPVPGVDDGFFLLATRLVSYKNPSAVIEAFRALPGERLVVAGAGPEEQRLRAIAPANVVMLGDAEDDQMRWLYAHCRALIAAGYEPYGLTPVEAAAFGKGTIALAADGLLDTVIEGETGVRFDQPTPDAISAAVARLSDGDVDAAALRRLVDRNSQERFADDLQRIVTEESKG